MPVKMFPNVESTLVIVGSVVVVDSIEVLEEVEVPSEKGEYTIKIELQLKRK